MEEDETSAPYCCCIGSYLEVKSEEVRDGLCTCGMRTAVEHYCLWGPRVEVDCSSVLVTPAENSCAFSGHC